MLPIGHIINKNYRVERLLGHGGMAEVYEVCGTRLAKRFALKIVAANLSNQLGLLDRFKREADILAALNNSHIVNIIDTDMYDGQYPYLVMELLQGQDLAQYLLARGALVKSLALPIFGQIAEALQAAHSAAIVHRDLKPANIFIIDNGPSKDFVKVLDFGVAKVLNSDSPLQTAAAMLMGTPAYMAPEQAMGHNHLVDARTDQFALASILYELLAGRPAFFSPGDSTLATLTKVVNEEPPPLDDALLWPIIARALSKEPSRRFPTLREFADAVLAPEAYALPPTLKERLPPPVAVPAVPAAKLSQFSNQGTIAATAVPELGSPLPASAVPTLAPPPALAVPAPAPSQSPAVPAPAVPAPAPPQDSRLATTVTMGILALGLATALLARHAWHSSSAGPARRDLATATILNTLPPPAVLLPPTVTEPAAGFPAALPLQPASESQPAAIPSPQPAISDSKPDTALALTPPGTSPRPASQTPPAEGSRKTVAATPLIELTERLGRGAVALPGRTLLSASNQAKLRSCAAAFYKAEAGSRREPLELMVLRDRAERSRLHWNVGKTGFDFDRHGPRDFDSCINQIQDPDIPQPLVGVTIAFQLARPGKNLP